VNRTGQLIAPGTVVAKALLDRRFWGGVLVALATTACGKSSPAAPSPPATASVTISSIAVTAEQQVSGGYTYRAVLQLREMNGVTATIVAADLTFFAGTTSLVTSHQEHPISDGSNVCPANGTVSSRELTTADSDPSHSHATSVRVAVTFMDPLSQTGTATATADVPPPVTPPPEPTFTLAGVVSDESTDRAIRGASVRVLDGSNAGRESSTDSNGYDSIPGLITGSFTVRATADRYESRDTGITFEPTRDSI
jgi:Carboxypeptidase regulatory-like domain